MFDSEAASYNYSSTSVRHPRTRLTFISMATCSNNTPRSMDGERWVMVARRPARGTYRRDLARAWPFSFRDDVACISNMGR